MTLADLATKTRVEILDDLLEDQLWSDDVLLGYAMEAVTEACLRAPILNRASSINIIAGTADYALDKTIRQIYTAKLDLQDNPLIQLSEAELALKRGSAWRKHTGTPTHYIRRGQVITLYPQPIIADTCVISASSTPDFDNFELDDINSIYHHQLCYYIAYKALSLRDADAENLAKALQFLGFFDQAFGVKHSAKYDSVNFEMPMYARTAYPALF